MTIQEVVQKLQAEKQREVPARYHGRAILVNDIAQYAELLAALKRISGARVVGMDELFSSADVMPNYQKLMEKAYENQWIILPGVSEYLRLFHINEETAQRFGHLWHHQFTASSTGRILIPLWGCQTLWHDPKLGLCDNARQDEDVFDCTVPGCEPQRMNIHVLSGDFEQYMERLSTQNGYVSFGLREWYGFWCEPQLGITDHLILTRRHRSVKPTDGDMRIHVVRDTLSFVRENLHGGEKLNADNCPKTAQECLFGHALRGLALDDAILSALNVHDFSASDVMGKWAALSEGLKQLIFLWYDLHPDDSYLCFCVRQSRSIDELPVKLLMSIFPTRASHPEWVRESQMLIAAVPVERSDDYFVALNDMPSLEERLDYLTANSPRERSYILRLVGQWLRLDREAVYASQKLRELYPTLAAYLAADYPDAILNSYFSRYKTCKLSNTLPSDEDAWFAGFDADAYDYRYPIMSEAANDQTCALWIDALGIEWLPLLKWALETNGEGEVSSVRVAQARLPSETCFNEQWHQMALPYEKYDKLDKLAHKGVIDDRDYYACIEEQLQFVCKIVMYVNKLLKQYPRVLITGDHGTSRLAARFFHKLDGIPAPTNAEIGSHGRYCRIAEDVPLMQSQRAATDDDGNRYIVFANYDHYTKSGFAAGADDDAPIYGEIHGGASPEELLVPVIAINSSREMPLTGKWMMPDNTVKIQNRRAKCRIQFSKPVAALQANIGELAAACACGVAPSKEWSVTFSGMKLDRVSDFEVKVLADGTLVDMPPVTIKPALGGGDPF